MLRAVSLQRPIAISVVVSTSLLACRDDSARHAGASGATPPAQAAEEPTKVPFVKFYESMYVRMTIDDIGPLLLLYDTGSPDLVIDRAEASKLDLTAGEHDISVGSASLGRQKVTLAKTVIGGVALPGMKNEPVRGYVGNNVFEGHSVGIGVRDRELLVTNAMAPEQVPPVPDGVDPAPAAEVPFLLAKGYVSIPCSFARRTADQRCLFDTGVMTSLTLESYWKTLPHPRTEVLPQDAIDSRGTTLRAYFQRDEATMIGDQAVVGDAIKIAEEFDLLASVAKSVNQNLVGLVGMLTFESYFTTVDYPNQRLLFHRYADTSWRDPSPFVGYGFLLEPASMRIRFVSPNSSARTAGVTVDDTLVEYNGLLTTFAPPTLTLVQTIRGAQGEKGAFKIVRGDQTIPLTITAEDMLPVP